MKNVLFVAFLFIFNFTLRAQSELQIESLKTFAKTYGYVKYFHPSDEAAAVDWDKFAIYGATQIEKCGSEAEVLLALRKLYGPIAPSAHFVKTELLKPFDIATLKPENTNNYELTYWQHKGVSSGMVYNGRPYQSVRVNRQSITDNSASFGTVRTSVHAEKYRKKQFSYTAWVKVGEGTSGSGNLWFRVDNSDGSMGFFDNMGDRPIKSREWQQYEISGEVDSLAQSLVFGCFLQGKGKLYLDEIRLEYKEGDNWVDIPLENSGFESEKIGKRGPGSQWTSGGNGYAFDTASEAKYKGEKAAIIEFVGDLKKEKGKRIFDARPEFGEVIEKQIGDDITCQIPLVLYATKDHTFPMADAEELAALTETLESYAADPTLLEVRLGNVINTYNVFQHFYPYFDVVKVDWEAALEVALKSSFTDKTAKDHLITLEKFTAPLKDGHIRVSSPLSEGFTPPITWEWVEDKLIITHVFEKSSDLRIGDEVTHVDGQEAKAYFDEVKSRISAGTAGWLNYRAQQRSLFGAKDSKLILTVNGNNVELVRDKDYYRERRRSLPKKDLFKQLNDSVFYLNLDRTPMDKIEELMPQMERAKSIICDLRGYPKGNHNFIRHLLKSKDTTEAWMQVPRITHPDQENVSGFEHFNWKMTPKKPYLGDKQIIFIIDGSAISYAESYMGYIEGYDLATIIGQPTAGTNGNVNPFKLPGGYQISWTGMKVVKHDGSQQHAVGILPDIYLTKTIEGVKNAEDEFLQKAIELTQKPVINQKVLN